MPVWDCYHMIHRLPVHRFHLYWQHCDRWRYAGLTEMIRRMLKHGVEFADSGSSWNVVTVQHLRLFSMGSTKGYTVITSR